MDAARTPVERFEADLGRTVDRLRSMGLARLAASFEPEPTRADAGRDLAQRLADLAADLVGEPHRALPRLGDQAVGDQVAVTGRDLLSAALSAGERAADRFAAEATLVAAADDLLDVRRRV